MCSSERLKILSASTTGPSGAGVLSWVWTMAQNRTAHETFSLEMSYKMKKGGN